jgi:hypothetical protein
MDKPLTDEQNVGLHAFLQEVAPKGLAWNLHHGTHRAGRKVLELLKHHNASSKAPLSGGALQDFFKRAYPLAVREAGQAPTREEIEESKAAYGGSGFFHHSELAKHYSRRLKEHRAAMKAASKTPVLPAGSKRSRGAWPTYEHDPRLKFARRIPASSAFARKVTADTVSSIRSLDPTTSKRAQRFRRLGGSGLHGGAAAPIPINNGATGNPGDLEKYDKLMLPKADIQYTGTFGQPRRVNVIG